MKMRLMLLIFLGTFILGGCMQTKTQSPSNQEPNESQIATPAPTAAPTMEPTMTPATGSAQVKGAKTETKAADTVTLKTSQGDIVLKLNAQAAPKTVANFLTKANSGYYEGLTFHRVVPGFVIQGGDPKGDGTGGGDIPTELSQVPFKAGTLGVARGGDIKVSNDSQFFICIETEGCQHLTGQYTNFGEVVSGMDVVQKIQMGDTITSITEE